MWVKLTRNDLGAVLVDFDRLTHVVPRTGGGATLYFADETPDKKGEMKQRILAVKDSVAEVYNAIKAAEGGAAPVSKTRIAR